MRKFYFIVLLAFTYSITIHVPGDYITIQEGIDASFEGDTVLVADGFYYENLVLTKSIVLASHAIYDDLTDWIIYDDIFTEKWVINNEHIKNTHIIGNQPENEVFGSVILITPNADTCISPEVMGFSIENGLGTIVEALDEQGMPYSARMGGGILADVSDPFIHFNGFYDNGDETLISGGGSRLTSSTEDWSFNDLFLNATPRCEVTEFRLANNLYEGNDAQYGNSVANRFHEDAFDMSGSVFDVYNCGGDEDNSVSSVWVDVEDEATVDFADSQGNACAFTAPDVYVDSNIEEECLDEGCGFPNNPFKTITKTLEMILPSESNPVTIHLAEGTYSPETGEIFPIIMIDYVSIEGDDEETTILDAMQTNRVINLLFASNNMLSKLTITGGLAEFFGDWWSIEGILQPDMGGGIAIVGTYSTTLSQITIDSNQANQGGGIALFFSNPIMSDITIINNIANEDSYSAGGILIIEGSPIITNAIIDSNSGIAIYLNGGSPRLTNINMDNNISATYTFLIEGAEQVIVNNMNISGDIRINASAGSTNHSINFTNMTINDDGNSMKIYSSRVIFTNATIGCTVNAYSAANITFNNSIIWDNGDSLASSINIENLNPYDSSWPGSITINYSDIEGDTTWYGTGNINSDPLFNDPENGDFSLQNGSPCIDAGDPNSPIDPDGTTIDMGHQQNCDYWDECGICNGPGEELDCGCYDIIAPSCDCLGNQLDCNGICGGDSIIDVCGECDGDTVDINDCDTEIVGTTLEYGEVTNEYIELIFSTDVPCSGYQLWYTGPAINYVTGGMNDILDFWTTVSDFQILGFSMVSDVLPSGSYPLMYLYYEYPDDPEEFCINDPLLVDEYGFDYLTLSNEIGCISLGSDIVMGDTNGDGIVDILDIMRVVSYILDTLEFTETEYDAANYNGDDLIDILDIMMIVNFILS